jgi:hypothetical protein
VQPECNHPESKLVRLDEPRPLTAGERALLDRLVAVASSGTVWAGGDGKTSPVTDLPRAATLDFDYFDNGAPCE